MEWVPKPITDRQLLAERLIAEECAQQAKRHGMTRADFLRTAAATLTGFVVLNELSGSDVFAVTRKQCEIRRRSRGPREEALRDGRPAAPRGPRALSGRSGLHLRFRDGSAGGGCPTVVGQTNFIKEVFVDSETDVGVISGLPFGGIPLGPQAMLETRDRVNSLAGGAERCVAQAVCDPVAVFQSGPTSIASLEGQVQRRARRHATPTAATGDSTTRRSRTDA
jgi:hypothetical protein